MGSDISRLQKNYKGECVKKLKKLSLNASSQPPTIHIASSNSLGQVETDMGNVFPENPGNSPRTSITLSIESRSRSGSRDKNSSKKCSITIKNRNLIQSCFNNPHETIGNRILKRSAENRMDFSFFYNSQKLENRDRMADTIKMLLKRSVAVIDGADEKFAILGVEFGQRFVEFRLFGFKADYFSALADATITECVLLDAAVHPAKVTLNAFSQFITMLFSSVRDGFYTEMRRLRRFRLEQSKSSNNLLSGNINLQAEIFVLRKSSSSTNLNSVANQTGSSSGDEKLVVGDSKFFNQIYARGDKTVQHPLKTTEELRLLISEFLFYADAIMLVPWKGNHLISR